MIRELVVWVAMLRTEYASSSRVASTRAVRFDLDHVAGEVVERIFTLPPSRIARRVTLERCPEIPAAIAQYHDRTRRRIDERRARIGLHRGVILREWERGKEVEPVARGCGAKR